MPYQIPSQSQASVSPDNASMLRTLNAFAVDLIQIPSMEDLFWYVAQNVVGRLNFVDCVIYQADDEQCVLRQVAAWGDKNPFGRSIVDPLVIPFGSGITGHVAAFRKAIIVDDLLKDQNYIPDTLPARSEICVPLMFRGCVAGVIDCEHPDPHAFGEAELEILSTVAAMASAKLELLAEAQSSAQRYRELVASHEALTRETDRRKTLELKLFEARRLEAIGKLTGRFAHEFNNLLTVVLGNLEFLAGDLAAAEAPQYLFEAKAAADSGARLIRDMLAFAQRTRLVPVAINLSELISRSYSGEANGSRHGIDLQLAEDLWAISVDRKAMVTILANLVENAKDAIATGGSIKIEARNEVHSLTDSTQLAVQLPPGRYVRLVVTDNGIGIPRDRLMRVFDPFYTTKSIEAGTGLGLSIVRGLTQQSGGTIWIDSLLGQGTTVYVLFPAIL